MSLTYFLSGWHRVSVEAAYAADLLEICRTEHMPYDSFASNPGGGICVRMRWRQVQRLQKVCAVHEIPVTVEPLRGAPYLFYRILQRPGVAVGVALGVVLLVLSSRVVWDIRISGTQTLSARDVKETLAACGFTVGTPLKGFAADVTENRALLHDRRLAWISINRRGCVAYVQVREAAYPPDTGAETPANVVAAYAGRIQRVELIRGNLLVAAGQEVQKGQILISGLYDSERVGFRWTHADGHVYARTVREFLIEIPLRYQQKQPVLPTDDTDSQVECEISLIFFGKNIKFSKKTRNEGEFCDTIESEKSFSLLPGVGFPISLRYTWYVPSSETTLPAVRTPAEAEEMAYLELARRMAAIPGGVELLRKTITPTLTDECFRLEVTVVCIEDIAQTSPFEVTE